MALAINTAPVAAVADTSNVTSYATASFTPDANSILIVYVYGSATTATGSISGGSLTWNLAVRVTGSGDGQWIWWASVGGSPSSMTITFDCTGDAATGAFIKVVSITGYNTDSPIVQASAVTSRVTGTNPTMTISQNMQTQNMYLAFIESSLNPVGATATAGWTGFANTGFSSPSAGLYAEYRINGETGNTVTVTAASQTYGTAFIEISAPVTAHNFSLLGVGI